jgi:hypothetical protein
MQMRMAATLPSSASWAARLAMFSAAPLSRLCTMLVARLREPGGRPAGFPLWPFRNWGILLIPLLGLGFGMRGRRRPENASVWGWAPRTQGVFGVPRLRAMKNPARFPGPGLGTLLKDIFLYLGPVSTSRSQKLHRSHKLHPRTGCIRHPKKYLLGTPTVGVRPYVDPAIANRLFQSAPKQGGGLRDGRLPEQVARRRKARAKNPSGARALCCCAGLAVGYLSGGLAGAGAACPKRIRKKNGQSEHVLALATQRSTIAS